MENLTNLISLRPAIPADEPRLHALIEASVRSLQKNDYSPEQINGALGTLLGLDTQLVADGTYLVAEAKAACARIIVGCGGWSHRKTLFGSDHAPVRENDFLDPATDAAKIRAFFIHPDWARRGIGSRILEACESAAALPASLASKWEPPSPAFHSTSPAATTSSNASKSRCITAPLCPSSAWQSPTPRQSQNRATARPAASSPAQALHDQNSLHRSFSEAAHNTPLPFPFAAPRRQLEQPRKDR